MSSKKKPEICLFIPLKKELDFARTVLGKYGKLSTARGPTILYKFSGIFSKKAPGKEISIQVCLIEDMGNWPTAAFVAWALGAHTPTLAVLAGIAGSMNPNSHDVGDVIISDTAKIIYPNKIKQLDPKKEVFVESHDPSITDMIQIDVRNKMYSNSFLRMKRRRYAPEVYDGELKTYITNMLTKCKNGGLTDDETKILTSIKYGEIFASEQVIDCKDTIEYILEKTANDDLDYYKQKDLLSSENEYNGNEWTSSLAEVVDMESAGFLNAIEVHSMYADVRPLIVRGISDLCADKADGDQSIAASNAIFSALAMIELFKNESL
jgi:nucleoside phosphorylase